MLKTLMKKQLMEVNLWLLMDKKRGIRRSGGAIAAYLVLYFVLFAFLGSIFYALGTMLCPPLHALGLDWLYFAMMSLIALMLGLFGSVFTTSETLYQAKDNSLLFSMPIPPRHILVTRLAGVWLWDVIYTALVFVPALLCYWVHCSAAPLTVACGLLALVLLSMLVLALSCALGWCVARLTAKLKRKSFFTVLLSVLFLAAYYLVYFRINEILQGILTHAQEVGDVLSTIFPFYWLGQAATGNGISLLLFALLICACMALVLYLMDRSLLKMATFSASAEKKAYRRTALKAASPDSALLRKDLRRFTGSATYMMNCGLGCLMLPILGIAALIKATALRELLVLGAENVALLACAVVCMATAMNMLTAPSVSLEGRQLWLLQVMPVLPWQVLKAKLKLHILFTEPPTLFCSVCLCIALRPSAPFAAFLVILPALFVLLSAMFGLAVNLKLPNLTWSSEAAAIKQSASTFFAMFGGWCFVIALGALYFLLRSVLAPLSYLLVCTTLLAALSALLFLWLRSRGSLIFSRL